MLSAMNSMPTRKIYKFIYNYAFPWIEKNKRDILDPDKYDTADYFRDGMNAEQYKKFRFLISSERTKNMIIEKAKKHGDEALTDEDWADLRATDF